LPARDRTVAGRPIQQERPIVTNYKVLQRSQSWYGEDIGIMILDAAYPCVPGNVGNATSFQFPVRYEEIEGASIDRLLNQRDPELIQPFIQAAKRLEARGVKAIAGACGFMALFQKEVSAAVNIPVGLSSLIQIPLIRAVCGGPVGIITANSEQLTATHFSACGIDLATPLFVTGMENCPEFSSAILQEKGSLDDDLIRTEAVKTAVKLQSENPEIRAILLECSDLPPYAADIQTATGLPVFDFNTLIRFLRDGVRQRAYQGNM
tara:strand:+ start:316 stop:1107 length:792 start_codon:yes stop_codon:yes gene_type:complete